MVGDLRNLLWLQWRLTLGIFRSRRARHRLRALAQVVQALQYVVTIPIVLALGAGVAVGLALLSPTAAFSVAVAINLVLAFLWLLTPLFEESRVVERFDLLRLVQFPLSQRSLAVGSAVASATSLSGLATAPVLAGQVVGLSVHNPLAFPLIAVGGASTFAVLILIGRLIGDLFDVATYDRRWRGVLVTALSLPLFTVWIVQAFLPTLGGEVIGRLLSPERLEALSQAEGPSAFFEALGLAGLATFLPFSWPTAAMGAAALRSWGGALLFTALSLGLVGGMFLAHMALTRRIMRGEILRGKTVRLRSTTWRARLPGPPELGTLLTKDWLYLWRSPYGRRMLLMTVTMSILMAVLFLGVLQPSRATPEEGALQGMAVAFGLGWAAFAGMVINVSLTANYFGSVDREGLGTIVNSGVDRRYVLLSASILGGTLTVGCALVPLAASALLGLPWTVIPLGLYAAVCMQLLGTPMYMLSSVIGPYRAQWRVASQQSGNLWGMLAWIVATAPIAALVAVPWFVWRPGLWLALPAALALGLAATALSLDPLARLMLRREHDVLEAVTREE